jgi:CheY-like chemotaxis protein
MAAAPQLNPDICVPPTSAGLPALAIAASPGGSASAARKGALHAARYASEVRVRVLVVDADERSRSVLEARLSAEGCDVIAVESSAEALHQLSPGRPLPTVIVSAAELSGMDGWTLCERVRADERTSQVPFILLSRGADAAHLDAGGVSSAVLTLTKPVFANDVVTAVKLWMDRSASQQLIETDTGQVPLPQALRALLSSTRSGRIYFQQGRAQLSFREGRVVDATFDALEESEAVARMLLLAQGPYAVGFGPSLARATCSLGLEELCGRLFPRLARWEKVVLRSMPLDAVLAADFKRLREELDQLPEGINQILRLFDGRRTVRDVVRECALAEVTTLEAINRLYAMGVLAPLPPGAEPEDAAPRLPVLRLFEPAEVQPTAEERMALLFGEELPSPPEPPPAGHDWFDEVSPAQVRQMDAFRIQPVTEVPRPAPEPPAEVAAFAAGRSAVEEAPTPSPTAVADDDLEKGFFSSSADETPRLRPMKQKAAPAPERPGFRIDRELAVNFVGSFCLAVLLGLAVWQISARISKRPTAYVAQVQPGAPAPVPPAPAVAVPPAPAPEVRATAAGPTLDDGVRLYQEGNAQDAAAILARVVDADPQSPEAWLMLGLARFDSNDTVGAHDAATRAAELAPNNGRVHLLLASIFLDEKDRPQAEAELKRYLELEPKGEFASEAHQLLGAR